ncbi:MAG: acyl-CoA thioesterase [Salinarimonas sp.]|nr:acyl-CoA thioesterase [Salinarimonas sp.]
MTEATKNNTRPQPLPRDAFVQFRPMPTRWMDNDVYGHVNNVVYYSYFDTAVNAFLVENGLLDITGSEVVGLVAETGCSYFESVAFPDALETGLAVTRLGRSSVTYRIGVFREGAPRAAAQGHFVHVYVARESGRPATIPDHVRAALSTLQANET